MAPPGQVRAWRQAISTLSVCCQMTVGKAMSGYRLSEKDAIDIWIARWLRVRPKDILARYDCDARRIYEVWEGRRYPKAREAALEVFKRTYPELVGQTDFSFHRRLSTRARPDPERQPDLFAWGEAKAR